MFLRHPNIVPFVGVPLTAHFIGDVVLVSEWMEEGTISGYLQRHPYKHRAAFVRIYPALSLWPMLMHCQMRDILHGLMYMHNLDVIHGDLKAVRRSSCLALP
jgi:serine/threonine protein kinase